MEKLETEKVRGLVRSISINEDLAVISKLRFEIKTKQKEIDYKFSQIAQKKHELYKVLDIKDGIDAT